MDFQTLEAAKDLLSLEMFTGFMIYAAVGAVTMCVACLGVFFISRRNRNRAAPTKPPRPRFRKRDKVMFYGRKMLRKVGRLKDEFLPEIDTNEVRRFRNTPSRRRSMVFPKFAERFLRRPRVETQRLLKEPPASLLEADFLDSKGSEPNLPSEVMFLLQSVRVFGHFERPLFFELCKYVETKSIPAGARLFKPGPIDSCICIVKSGELNVNLVSKSGTEVLLKKVQPGDNIHSVVNILDAIRGSFEYRFSISATALVDSEVLKLPSKAFQEVFKDNPESLVRITQVIMLRLQQVTFQALHRFLGLSSELITAVPESRRAAALKKLSVYSLDSTKASDQEDNTSKKSSILSAQKGFVLHDDNSGPESSSETKMSRQPADDSNNKSKKPVEKPIKRNVSFTSVVSVRKLNEEDGKTNNTETAPLVIQRSSSYGRLQRSVSRSDYEDSSAPLTSPSDFEAACGRAGLMRFDSTYSGSFHAGGSSDGGSPTGEEKFEFPSLNSGSIGLMSEGIPGASSFPHRIDSEEEEIMLEAATDDLVTILGLPNASLLDDMLAIASVPSHTAIVKCGDKDCSLYFVVKGILSVRQPHKNGDEEILYRCIPGEMVGALAVLTGEPSAFTIKAEKLSYVVIISKMKFYNLMKNYPHVVLPVAHSLIQRLSSFVRNIDFALDWIVIDSGKALYRQGDDPDSVYIVLNGRLRAIMQRDSNRKEIVGEYGKGESVGLVEVLTQSKRMRSLHAVRDTELAKLPDGLLNTIKMHYPQVVTRLIHLLGDRILGTYKKPSSLGDSHLERIGANLGTIAVIPASNNVPLANFTFELSLAINDIGPTQLLTSDMVIRRLGRNALDSVHEYYLSSWLGQQEDVNQIVVYQADHYMSEWTKRCIRQADAILIVGLGKDEPKIEQLEAQLETMTSVRAQKDLILLYREDTNDRPCRTVEWLNARGWISAHHHVRCRKRIFKSRLLADRYANDPELEGPSRNSDFARLARRLTGTSVGLVLGGGGARGLSHLGIIRALVESGIPIDMVGGTSIGALVGALYADDVDISKSCVRARQFAKNMSSLTKKLIDLTYPYTSLFSGAVFNEGIQNVVGDKAIEDLLLPYFCITTDITSSKMNVHQTGSLWRYVRASMSLSGYLPPLCDPVDGHLLLDGGYVNNLPADVMRSLGAKTIIAVDVGSEDETNLTNYGDSLSGWWLLWKKWNPFASNVKILNLAEIQSRLAFVSCNRQLEEVKNSSYCQIIRPPINRFKTLQFGLFDVIMNTGYEHGKQVFKTLLKDLAFTYSGEDEDRESKRSTFTVGNFDQCAPSFTDLAELVSKINPPQGRNASKWMSTYSHTNAELNDQDQSIEDEYDETDLYIARRARTGSLSDQDFMTDHDIEVGYESEDLGRLRRRNIEPSIFTRMQSNPT